MKSTLQIVAASILFASSTLASGPLGTEKTSDGKFQYTLPAGWTKGRAEKKDKGVVVVSHVKKKDGNSVAIIKLTELPTTYDTEKISEVLKTNYEEQNYTQESRKAVKVGAIKAYRHKWSVPADDGTITLEDLVFVVNKKLYMWEFWYGEAKDKETVLTSVKAAAGGTTEEEEPTTDPDDPPPPDPDEEESSTLQTVQKIQFDLAVPPWKKEASPKNKANAQFALSKSRNMVGVLNVFIMAADQNTPENYGSTLEGDGWTASEDKPDAATAKAVKALGGKMIDYVNSENVHDVTLWIKHGGKMYVVGFMHAGDADALKAWKKLVATLKKK